MDSKVKLDQILYRFLVDKTNPKLTYLKSVREYFLGALSVATYLPIKEKYITFSHPEVDNTTEIYNSKIRVNVERESGFRGYKELKYIRQEIEDLVTARNIYGDFKPDASILKTTVDVLDEFNRIYGTQLPRSEIEDTVLDLTEVVRLVASNGSFFFIPGSIVELGHFYNADRYWDLVEGTFTIPEATQSRMRSTSENESRYTLELSGHYSERRI